ncbi:MAG: ldh 2 [Gammaproteobacteria bacterium]|jgi:leucine dehydrogenase|nr:ldh 2 [Gammaproteobacteria bacterium]
MLLQEKTFTSSEHNDCNRLFKYAEDLGFGDIKFKIDAKTGLRAIIAIHNKERGPAIGGCRHIYYDSYDKALEDVIRLAHGMSSKAAICNLPRGGAKSVILRPTIIKDREAFFRSFGEFVHEQQGAYIVAEDSGTSPADMDIIAQVTPYVTCTSAGGGDPSPYTALGLCRSIEAAVKFKLGSNLNGIRVAIQGTGHVGYYLARELANLGAKIIVTDIDQTSANRCATEFDGQVVSPDAIYSIECDVFAPCALGAILNDTTIPLLKASIVAGSANNQLAHKHHGVMLHQRGILYAPDFLVNAGGLIYASANYDHIDLKEAKAQIEGLYQSLWDVLERAKAENKPVSEVVDEIVEERLTP